MGKILVVAEHLSGKVSPVTYELMAFADELSEEFPDGVSATVIGEEIDGLAEEISGETGVDVFEVLTPGAGPYNADTWKTVLRELVESIKPSYICAAHTARGLDFAPGLAAGLGAACITGVTGVSGSGGSANFSRPVYNGKINRTIVPESEVTVLTVQPGVFRYRPGREPGRGKVIRTERPAGPVRLVNSGLKERNADTSTLKEARVVVAAGRGVGKSENLETILKFAEIFTNSAMAVSRPLVDSGWAEYARQVGLTGATVKPDLYVACGISGASQHLAGMRESKFVVAVNSDPNAAIFNHADVCVVEDLLPFIRKVIDLSGAES